MIQSGQGRAAIGKILNWSQALLLTKIGLVFSDRQTYPANIQAPCQSPLSLFSV